MACWGFDVGQSLPRFTTDSQLLRRASRDQLQIWFPLHVLPAAQTSPAQQGWPAPPQTEHVLSAQTNGDAQLSPPTFPAQHR